MSLSHSGWDEYAPFYDWENARTIGRRDVAYWAGLAAGRGGRALELGCGTGRLLIPLARAGATIAGIDRSAPMLARARARVRRLPPQARPSLIRGDIRALPLRDRTVSLILAPYGVLQSLTTDADLDATLREAARVLARRGVLAIDLVPDLPAWQSYRKSFRLRGRLRGAGVTLVESVRQDRRRGLTIFDEEFITGTGRRARRHRFSLTFRTLAMDAFIARVAAAGFSVDAVTGDYRGGAWTPDADTWLVTAIRR